MNTMKIKELISVIIPVYNVENYLSNCIDSVINQTYKNLEIILVDDGSIDSSAKICDEYAKKDGRIKVIHKENGGLSSARNAGLDIAKGKYISFVDSDDTINFEMIEKMLNSIVRYKTDVSICKLKITRDYTNTNEVISEDEFVEVITPLELYDKLYDNLQAEMTSSCNKIYKKELFDNLRFKNGIINEDDEILHYIVDKINNISYINVAYYNYYQRGNSIMHKPNPKAKQSVENLIIRGNYFLRKKMIKYYEMNSYLICYLLAKFYKSLDNNYYNQNIKKYSKIVLSSKYCNFKKKLIVFLIRIHHKMFDLLMSLGK